MNIKFFEQLAEKLEGFRVETDIYERKFISNGKEYNHGKIQFRLNNNDVHCTGHLSKYRNL